MVREYKIEQYAVEELNNLGAWPIKYTSTMERGLPDRLVLFPNGYHLWIEFKRSNRYVLAPLQKVQCNRLITYKQRVLLVNSFSGVDKVLYEGQEKGWFTW